MGNFAQCRHPLLRLRRGLAVAVGVVLLAAGPVQASDAETAKSVVVRMQGVASSGKAGIASSMHKFIDMTAVAKKVLGDAWASASAHERHEFIEVLQDLMARHLVEQLRDGDQFAISGTKSIGGRDVVVLTTMTRKRGESRRLDWKLHPCGTTYCVYDLVWNGASTALAKRDDYKARLKALGGSLAALTQELRSGKKAKS